MDGEIRGEFKELKDQINTGQVRIEAKVEMLTNAFNTHVVESATRYTRVEAKAESAHHRIDAHMKGHWWVLGIVGGIMTAMGSAIAIALFKLISKTP